VDLVLDLLLQFFLISVLLYNSSVNCSNSMFWLLDLELIKGISEARSVNPVFLLFFFLLILGESNRVPFDLPEAESELVAGFITEYSSIYFTLILLTEYGNIIDMSF